MSWKENAKRCRGITVKLFYGMMSSFVVEERPGVLGPTFADLLFMQHNLSPSEETTGLVCILSTYSTLRSRLDLKTITLTNDYLACFKTANGLGQKSSAEDVEAKVSTGWPVAGVKLIAGKALGSKEVFHNLWSVVVGDEIHAAKHGTTGIGTLIREILESSPKIVMAMLTATPLINRPRDLAGLLELFQALTGLENLSEKLSAMDYEQCKHGIMSVNAEIQYAPATSLFGLTQSVLTQQHMRLLDPNSYAFLAAPRYPPYQMSPEHGAMVLPAIMGLIQLRRTTGDVINVGSVAVVIGDNIMPIVAQTLELKASIKMHDQYLGVHARRVRGLNHGGQMTSNGFEGRQDMAVSTRLKHVVYDSRLDIVAQNIDNSAMSVSDMHSQFSGRSADVYHAAVRRGEPGFTSAMETALWMASSSPKSAATAAIVLNHLRRGEKCLLFYDPPINLWVGKAFFEELGVPLCVLRANTSQAEREAVVNQFNQPGGPMLLLTTISVGGQSWSLHHCCRTIIFCDLPSSVNTTYQCIGRGRRIGQMKVVLVYILLLDHTMDQRVIHRHFNKKASEIASMLPTTTTPANSDITGVFKKMYGLRYDPSSPLLASADPFAKDDIPEERAYLSEWCLKRKLAGSKRSKLDWFSPEFIGEY
jgi:hypothetical protein